MGNRCEWASVPYWLQLHQDHKENADKGNFTFLQQVKKSTRFHTDMYMNHNLLISLNESRILSVLLKSFEPVTSFYR